MRKLARLGVTSLVCCLITLVATTGASAGTYKAFSCQFPDGRPASISGWHVTVPAGGVSYDVACSDGTGFGVTTLGNRVYPRGFQTGVDIAAPPHVLIVGARAKQYLYSTGSITGEWAWMAGSWAAYPAEPGWRGLDYCYGAVGVCDAHKEPYRVLLNYPHDSPRRALRIGISCDFNRGDCPPATGATSYASSVELTLEDASPPEFQSPPTGTLLDPASQGAIRDLRFSVADKGSGLRKAVLEVDGQPPQAVPLGETAERCVPPYDAMVPCPARASGAFSVDTTSFPTGNYSARLLVYDATETSPLTYAFTVHKAGEIRSCDPGHFFRAAIRPRAVRYRESRRLSFRVRSSTTLPDQLLVLRGGAVVKPVGHAKLRRGRYVTRMEPGPSRVLRLAPPPRLGEVTYRCSNPVSVHVKAGIRFQARPKTLRNGETVAFRGRLLGGRIAGGRSILIQARARGGTPRWTPVQVVRTRRRGGFAMSYTFRRTQQRVRYEFRALWRKEEGFPYRSSASPVRTVLVRP
jgi:hypothetical protein